MSVNPITLEVIRHAYESVAEQMTAKVSQTSYSDVVKEGKDCSSAIFDQRGHITPTILFPSNRFFGMMNC
jgi:N-methylhydantoinase B